jgi:hypothetical protein
MDFLWIAFALLSTAIIVLLAIFLSNMINDDDGGGDSGRGGGGSNKDRVFAFVHHPKCKICHDLEPLMRSLQTTYGEDTVVLINALTDRPARWAYANAAQGYPTMGVLDVASDTITEEYFGKRDAASVSKFINDKVVD